MFGFLKEKLKKTIKDIGEKIIGKKEEKPVLEKIIPARQKQEDKILETAEKRLEKVHEEIKEEASEVIEEVKEEPAEEKKGFFQKIKEAVAEKTISSSDFEKIFEPIHMVLLENNV